MCSEANSQSFDQSLFFYSSFNKFSSQTESCYFPLETCGISTLNLNPLYLQYKSQVIDQNIDPVDHTPTDAMHSFPAINSIIIVHRFCEEQKCSDCNF